MQHALTSLPLSKPQLFPTTQPITPPTSSKPTFTIQAAVHPRKESILNPTGLILRLTDSFHIFFSLCTFLQVPLIKVKLDSDGSISYQVKISLNAKRVQCLKGLSELERIRVVAFPERRKKIIEKIKKRWLTFFLFCFGPTTLYSSSAVG